MGEREGGSCAELLHQAGRRGRGCARVDSVAGRATSAVRASLTYHSGRPVVPGEPACQSGLGVPRQ
jgi:hypothetical protein